MALGAGFTLWDTVEGFSRAESMAKEVAKTLIKEKISQAEGNAKWLQEMGIITSTDRLRELGFTDEELKQFGLLKAVSKCE